MELLIVLLLFGGLFLIGVGIAIWDYEGEVHFLVGGVIGFVVGILLLTNYEKSNTKYECTTIDNETVTCTSIEKESGTITGTLEDNTTVIIKSYKTKEE